MINRIRFTCKYCDNSWETNYLPQVEIYCGVCKDKNIKVVDISNSIDYYAGTKSYKESDDSGDWTFQEIVCVWFVQNG